MVGPVKSQPSHLTGKPRAITLKRMPERSPAREAQFLKERAARLREMAAGAMPRSVVGQLLEVAEDLEARAARLEEAASDALLMPRFS